MATIKSNIVHVGAQIKRRLGNLTNETILRPAVQGVRQLIQERIHTDGKDSAGQAIGFYSNGYMKIRMKGERKLKGGITEKFAKRSSDKKVVISLTRQLENDYAITPTQNGYGIGFKNSHNYDKSQWVQGKFIYNKRIFDMTKEEQEYVSNYVRELLIEQLNS
jgi:ribosomal protein S20